MILKPSACKELINPILHWQITPASSLWSQLCIPQPKLGHSESRVSVPLHSTLSSQIEPVPLANPPSAAPSLNPSCWHATAASMSSQLKSEDALSYINVKKLLTIYQFDLSPWQESTVVGRALICSNALVMKEFTIKRNSNLIWIWMKRARSIVPRQ